MPSNNPISALDQALIAQDVYKDVIARRINTNGWVKRIMHITKSQVYKHKPSLLISDNGLITLTSCVVR